MENQLKEINFTDQKMHRKNDYCAIFDPDTGAITKVGPIGAFRSEKNIAPMTKEMALDITEGRIKLQRCYFNFSTREIEILSVPKDFEKEKLLHKIPRYSKESADISEIYLTYNNFDSKLTIEMSAVFKGTKSFFKQKHEKPLLWNEDKEISLFVTNFNDPHVIHELIRFPIKELIGKKKEVIIKNLPNRFSIFTKKIFKNYLVEIIDENSRI